VVPPAFAAQVRCSLITVITVPSGLLTAQSSPCEGNLPVQTGNRSGFHWFSRPARTRRRLSER